MMGTSSKLIPNTVASNSDFHPEAEKESIKEKIPCGLKNLGNTCYFNSVNQLIHRVNGIDSFISRLILYPMYFSIFISLQDPRKSSLGKQRTESFGSSSEFV